MISKVGRGFKVYVAGPVTGSGTQAENARNAIAAAQLLADAGFVPFVPHLFFMWEMLGGTDEHFRMMCLEWLSTCDLMIRLPGVSPGSDKEEAMARKRGIDVWKCDGDVGDHMTPARRLIHAAKKWGMRDVGSTTPPQPGPPKDPFVVTPWQYSSFSGFQQAVAGWISRQPFADPPKHQPLLGMLEELGELSHAHLKNEQKIRGFDDEVKTRDAKMDAIGDIVVYMAGYCESNGLDFGECVSRAWEEVRLRDWNKNGAIGKATPAIMREDDPRPFSGFTPDGPGDGVRMTGADRQPSPYSDHRPGNMFRHPAPEDMHGACDGDGGSDAD